ncbi:MAG: glycoside hydrolase [Thermodesulfovibrionales bacterium]|nr:glycoside hydrolase [Thermodesulfovibrionales bacterium]
MLKKILVMIGIIVACAIQAMASAEVKVNAVYNKAAEPPLFLVDPGGNPLVLHYGNDDFLYIIKNKEVIQKLKKDGATGSFVWLGFSEEKPALIWRPEFSDTGNKFIYFQKADENLQIFEKEIVLNTAKDALLPVTVTQKDDKIYVTWVDERKPPVNIFMNYSTDYGRTFRDEDIPVTPGYISASGTLLVTDTMIYCFFIGRKSEDKNAGVHVTTSSDGVQWSEPVQLASYDEWVPAAIKTVLAQDKAVALWAGARGIGYAYLDSDGKWQPRFIEQTQDMDINRIEVMQSKSGDIYLLTSYRKVEETTIKPSVYIFTSQDGGRTWSEPVRINHNEYNNTSAQVPAMHITENGTIVVVWQDFRLIRGNILMNYSKDGGKTWLSEDINLNDEPGKHNDYYPYVTGYKDRVYVLIPRYQSDSLNVDEIDLYLKEVKIDE